MEKKLSMEISNKAWNSYATFMMVIIIIIIILYANLMRLIDARYWHLCGTLKWGLEFLVWIIVPNALQSTTQHVIWNAYI